MEALDFLRSDRTRPEGSREGLQRAAAWLAAEFLKLGLEPAGEARGYVQYWSPGPAGDTVRLPNVVGLLPGREDALDSEYVIVLANLGDLVRDTTGQHSGGGAIDPSENDGRYSPLHRGGGVAALMDVARALAALPEPLPRPVLFLAITGVDGHAGGAQWFADNPTVPLSDATAVLALGPGTQLSIDAAAGRVVPSDPAARSGPAVRSVPAAPAGPAVSWEPWVGSDVGAPAGGAFAAERGGAMAEDLIEVVADGSSFLDRFVEQIAVEHADLELRVVRVGASGSGEGVAARGQPLPFGRLGIPYVVVEPGPGVVRGGGGRLNGLDARMSRDARARQEWDADLLARVARLLFLGTYRLASAESRSEWTP